MDIELVKGDSESVEASQPVLRATGPVRTLLTAEKTTAWGLVIAPLLKTIALHPAGSLAAVSLLCGAKSQVFPWKSSVTALDQVAKAANIGAELILLDNMAPNIVRETVAITRPAGVRIEASRGITIDGVAEYRGAGIVYIAVGALTHSSRLSDLDFDLV